MIVYEEEDVREDGLQILANLARSSEENMTQVTDALLASVESGFGHEPQQRLRTVSFVRTIWAGRCLDVSRALSSSHVPPLSDSLGPLYPLAGRCIPSLVGVGLNADSTEVRQSALRLMKDLSATGTC